QLEDLPLRLQRALVCRLGLLSHLRHGPFRRTTFLPHRLDVLLDGAGVLADLAQVGLGLLLDLAEIPFQFLALALQGLGLLAELLKLPGRLLSLLPRRFCLPPDGLHVLVGGLQVLLELVGVPSGLLGGTGSFLEALLQRRRLGQFRRRSCCRLPRPGAGRLLPGARGGRRFCRLLPPCRRLAPCRLACFLRRSRRPLLGLAPPGRLPAAGPPFRGACHGSCSFFLSLEA